MSAEQKLTDLFFLIFMLSLIGLNEYGCKSALILTATAALYGLGRFDKWLEDDSKKPSLNNFVEVPVKKKSILRYVLPGRVINYIRNTTGLPLCIDQIYLGTPTVLRSTQKREWWPTLIWIIGILLAIYFLK